MEDMLKRMEYYNMPMKINSLTFAFLNTVMKFAEHISKPCNWRGIVDLLERRMKIDYESD